jgi:hypothetical protein
MSLSIGKGEGKGDAGECWRGNIGVEGTYLTETLSEHEDVMYQVSWTQTHTSQL